METDFLIEGAYIIPVSDYGKRICKKYKGVVMRKFTPPNIDEFIDTISRRFEGVVWSYNI